jgi:hypothetical protein
LLPWVVVPWLWTGPNGAAGEVLDRLLDLFNRLRRPDPAVGAQKGMGEVGRTNVARFHGHREHEGIDVRNVVAKLVEVSGIQLVAPHRPDEVRRIVRIHARVVVIAPNRIFTELEGGVIAGDLGAPVARAPRKWPRGTRTRSSPMKEGRLSWK